MEFGFKIKNDLMVPAETVRMITGNVNSYTCRFEFEDAPEGFLWICVFRQGDAAYQQVIKDGACIVPKEVLEKAEPVYVGCYATKDSGGFARISTNWIPIALSEGAYSDASAPEIPAPDVWEDLVFRKLPYIGENGNWFVYYPDIEGYADSNVLAKGYTPKKGVDYWTDSEVAEVKADIAESIMDGITLSVGKDGIVTATKED